MVVVARRRFTTIVYITTSSEAATNKKSLLLAAAGIHDLFAANHNLAVYVRSTALFKADFRAASGGGWFHD